MNNAVFVNRVLNLKKIKCIGLDMDHTLVRYNTQNFESLVFRLVIQELITHKHYPNSINQLTFTMQNAIRGLVIDSENGNILKLNRYGAIRQSCHGTKPMHFSEQQAFYRSTYVDLNNPNYMVVDTSFSIAFCVLYAHLVDFKDKNTQQLPSYQIIAQDVLASVDTVHANGSLKAQISANLDDFLIKDQTLVEGMQRYIRFGKKLFLLTNSEYTYTKQLLDYAINPYLPAGQSWLDLFEYVITIANKPRFFYDNLRFLHIDPASGTITNQHGPILPGVYQGGNATAFTDSLGLKGDEILYVGDHIYGDILRLKKDCNWRTALVIDELGEEIYAQKKARPIEQAIIQSMQIKKLLESRYITRLTQSRENDTVIDYEEIHDLQAELTAIDTTLTKLLEQQRAHYNPIWERVFRAGAEESYFAYQVDRYACIYMEKLSDLFNCSPMSYFRAHRRIMAHETLDSAVDDAFKEQANIL